MSRKSLPQDESGALLLPNDLTARELLGPGTFALAAMVGLPDPPPGSTWMPVGPRAWRLVSQPCHESTGEAPIEDPP